MKKCILAFTLLCSINAWSMEPQRILLPKADVVIERLKAVNVEGFDCEDFLAKTTLVKDLANKRAYPMQVALEVNTHLFGYCAFNKMEKLNSHIVGAFLADYPESIQDLKEMGVLE